MESNCCVTVPQPCTDDERAESEQLAGIASSLPGILRAGCEWQDENFPEKQENDG
jgi:hypothetical protein